jgi:hypothetical protein
MEGQGGGNPDLAVFKLTEGYVVYCNGASVACNRVEELVEQVGRMLTAARPDRPPEMGGACEHPEDKVQSRGTTLNGRHLLGSFCTQCGHRWQTDVTPPVVEAPTCQHPQSEWRTRPATQNIVCAGCGAEVGKLPPVDQPDFGMPAPKVQARGVNVPRGLEAEQVNLQKLAHGIVAGIIRPDQMWAIAERVCPHIPRVDINEALDQAEHAYYEQRQPEAGRLRDGEDSEYDPRMGPIRVPGDFGPEDRSLFGKEPTLWSSSQAPEGMISVEDGATQCACPGCAYQAGAGDICVACHNGTHPHRMVQGREYSDRQGKSFVFNTPTGGKDSGNGRKVRASRSRRKDPVSPDVQSRNNGAMGDPGEG